MKRIVRLAWSPARLRPSIPRAIHYRLAAVVFAMGIAHAAESEPGRMPPAIPLTPSPSTASGKRINPPPVLTHWPAIAYFDEQRDVAFRIAYADGMPASAYSAPVPLAGDAGAVGWQGGPSMPIVLPPGGEMISGLLPLPVRVGERTAEIALGTGIVRLGVVLADVHQPWPIVGLRDGFPIDARDRPVVLVDRRRDPADARKWSALAAATARPGGRPLIVGDPLAALGSDAWAGLDADLRPALDQRYPQHAVLAALAALPEPMPRTIVWCPGNAVISGGAWSPEEERILGAIRSRCTVDGTRPRLTLALPPDPAPGEARLARQAAERRELLLHTAISQGWEVIDLARAAGDARQANRVADDIYATHPVGPAQARMRDALRMELTR